MKFQHKEVAMLENIQVGIDDVKEFCAKYEFNLDTFWMEVNRRFNLSRAEKASDRKKRNGVPTSLLFQIAVALPLFCGRGVRSFFSGQYKKMIDCGAIPFYRFLQDPAFNWRKVLYQLNSQIRSAADADRDLRRHPKALILDDTVICKTGKRIEGVSRVHDHVSGKSVNGFKLLGLCWFDGFYSRFLDFSLVAEKAISFKRSKPQFKKKRDPDSPARQRKKELKKDKITLACELIRGAVRHRFIPDYLLVDTWFTCSELINTVRKLANGGIHFLGMVKNGKRKFEYDGKTFTLSQLRKHVMSRAKRCSRFKSGYVVVDCVIPEVGRVRLFFSRFHRSRKWVALLTTDMEMSYVKAIETYSIRWNIEIGFKETKQLLGLGKCQANDFSSQLAHTTSVFIMHAILATCKDREDHQSLGVLFESLREQYTKLLTMDKILISLEYILRTIGDDLGGIGNVTLRELFDSREYLLFKEALGNSLSFNVDFAKDALILDSEYDTRNKIKMAS